MLGFVQTNVTHLVSFALAKELLLEPVLLENQLVLHVLLEVNNAFVRFKT